MAPRGEVEKEMTMPIRTAIHHIEMFLRRIVERE